MIGYDDKGNQFGSPAYSSHFRNSRTSADRKAQQKDYEWYVKRKYAMQKLKKENLSLYHQTYWGSDSMGSCQE